MKTPEARMQRARRLVLLRNPPSVKADNRPLRAAIMAELALIHNNPRLAGNKKHELFLRGAKQLSEL
jgi:hypothetical protein